MKKVLKFIGIIFGIIVILFALFMFMPRIEKVSSGSDGGVLSEGDMAPDFTAELVNGLTFTLSDHSDECVLINFWATWCGPCVGEMPAFEKLKEDDIDNLEIICINCREDRKTVDRFVKENGYTFNIAYDTNGAIGNSYPTNGIPYTVIVYKGKIEKIYVGALDAQTQYNEYLSAIKECLGE